MSLGMFFFVAFAALNAIVCLTLAWATARDALSEWRRGLYLAHDDARYAVCFTLAALVPGSLLVWFLALQLSDFCRAAWRVLVLAFGDSPAPAAPVVTRPAPDMQKLRRAADAARKRAAARREKSR